MQIETLKNGLRFVSAEKKDAKTVALLLMIKVGSRYETPSQWGMAHFLEHMVFKGTKKRPNTMAIAEYLDKIGGDYNAFTGDEYTGFHAHVAKEHCEKAVDFICDLVGQPLFKENDFNVEKGVITEEIKLHQDMPMHVVDDLFSEAMFGDDPLAHRVAGSIETIKNMTLRAISKFYQKYYQSGQMAMVAVAKKETLAKIKLSINKYYSNQTGQNKKISPNKVVKGVPRAVYQTKPIEQGNLIIGFEGPAFSSTDRYPMMLLCDLLGGMMSSRMFLNIREKQGLCYYIKTGMNSFESCGILSTQAGVDPKNLTKTVKAILKEYQNIKNQSISPDELKKAKEYAKGKLALGIEDSEEIASFYGHQVILAGKILSPEEIIKKIDSVSAVDILEVAKKYFTRETLTLAAVSPKINQDKINSLIEAY